MEIMAVIKLIPIVLSVVEMTKRFIPDEKRTYVNPIMGDRLIKGTEAGETPPPEGICMKSI